MTAKPRVTSRKEAKALGHARYFTGNPCKHGHVAERNVHGHCLECHRVEGRSRYRKDLSVSRKKAREHAACWRADNRARHLEIKRDWYRANKTKVRDEVRFRKYGMTKIQFDDLLRAQGGGCGVCGAKEIPHPGIWHVDHEHASGKVRGLVCPACNVGLGYFKDSPSTLRKAAEYLERTKA